MQLQQLLSILLKINPLKTYKAKRFIGIDPGTNAMGFAIIEVVNSQIRVITLGTLNIKREYSSSEKLKVIFESVQQLIKKYKPEQMAIEAPFYGKNVQSMLKLGRAQGVAIAAGMTCNLEVEEYAPKKIKLAITGNGNASKEQVAAMLETLTHSKLDKASLDATDALGCAVCHYFQQSNALKGVKKHGGWDSFIKDNPDRVSKSK